MAITVSGTSITFNDATTQTTAATVAPTISQLGGIAQAFYTVATPTATSMSSALAFYGVGTTVAGSSLAYDVRWPNQVNNYGTISVAIDGAFDRAFAGQASSLAFPSTGAMGATYYPVARQGGRTWSGSTNATLSYSTLSGSWRSLSTTSVSTSRYCDTTGTWDSSLWQRYA